MLNTISWSFGGLISTNILYDISSSLFLFQKKHSHLFMIGLLGLTSGYIRGYTGTDIFSTLKNSMYQFITEK